MQAAYRNVPPENSTQSAVEDADESAGMAPIRAYVSKAETGDADENASNALWDFCHVHLAVMKLVASPKATGALCSTIATAMVSPKELLLDLLAAPTAKPSAMHQVRSRRSLRCSVPGPVGHYSSLLAGCMHACNMGHCLAAELT